MPMELCIPCFDPFAIARSGQCFRMHAVSPRVVVAVAGRDRLRVTALGKSRFRFDCGPEAFERLWRPYFDLDLDYGAIEARAKAGDETLCRAACACGGLRILRQDPWETLISFLISQRKSIKAIQSCIEKLCERYGEPLSGAAGYFAFPPPQALIAAGEDGLRACGTGYRAPYLLDAARRVCMGDVPLDGMRDWPNDRLMERLQTISGVGIKVASCVALFGFHRLDVSPVDVWIQRVIDESYGGESPFEAYGAYAGVFQQYLFLERLDSAHESRASKA